jgi:hypothetical protein
MITLGMDELFPIVLGNWRDFLVFSFFGDFDFSGDG